MGHAILTGHICLLFITNRTWCAVCTESPTNPEKPGKKKTSKKTCSIFLLCESGTLAKRPRRGIGRKFDGGGGALHFRPREASKQSRMYLRCHCCPCGRTPLPTPGPGPPPSRQSAGVVVSICTPHRAAFMSQHEISENLSPYLPLLGCAFPAEGPKWLAFLLREHTGSYPFTKVPPISIKCYLLVRSSRNAARPRR